MIPTMIRTLLIPLQVFFLTSIHHQHVANAVNAVDDDGCKGGSCPMPKESPPNDSSSCGLWLGPSDIKEHMGQGFGLGMFTGRNIRKGDVVDPSILIPLPDWDDELHPPLREYVWEGSHLINLSLQSKKGNFLFNPGLGKNAFCFCVIASLRYSCSSPRRLIVLFSLLSLVEFLLVLGAIAPCTSQNYNLDYLEQISLVGEARVVDRSNNPTAGSFTYLQSDMYVASRDIVAGEELTVECGDDDFDGGAYRLSHFDAANDSQVTCLDNTLKVGASSIRGAGRGLFAKRPVKKGEVLISTPLVPIHRDELELKERIAVNSDGTTSKGKQLILNYCFGHADSELVLLPYGPLVGYLNHPPNNNKANADIQWHSSPLNEKKLSRRQEHHHPELLELSAREVSSVHGKGLLIDIVATQEIAEGEEVFLDYGPEWTRAWKRHVENYETTKPQPSDYVSALEYAQRFDNTTHVRTVAEQLHVPYPTNLQTACSYAVDWKTASEDVDGGGDDDAYTTTASWYDWPVHENQECRLPCVILERYAAPVTDEETGTVSMKTLYKAKLLGEAVTENPDVIWDCQLNTNYEYILEDIPGTGIQMIDRPYTTDEFLPNAFRHELGVPEGFYPDTWMKNKVRRRDTSSSLDNASAADEFKRKEKRKPLVQKL
jgi:hypothetical protein